MISIKHNWLSFSLFLSWKNFLCIQFVNFNIHVLNVKSYEYFFWINTSIMIRFWVLRRLACLCCSRCWQNTQVEWLSVYRECDLFERKYWNVDTILGIVDFEAIPWLRNCLRIELTFFHMERMQACRKSFIISKNTL